MALSNKICSLFKTGELAIHLTTSSLSGNPNSNNGVTSNPEVNPSSADGTEEKSEPKLKKCLFMTTFNNAMDLDFKCPKCGGDLAFFENQDVKEFLKEKVEINAVHGGLETGVIGDKIPGIQMVSIGPTIKNPHTPDEKLEIKGVGIIYRLIKTILNRLPNL